MPYKDPDKQRDYQRKYVAAQRAAFLEGKKCKCGRPATRLSRRRDGGCPVRRLWSMAMSKRVEALRGFRLSCDRCFKQGESPTPTIVTPRPPKRAPEPAKPPAKSRWSKPLVARAKGGGAKTSAVSSSRNVCPKGGQHTTMPEDPRAWADAARRLEQTHVQGRCKACGAWFVWTPKWVVDSEPWDDGLLADTETETTPT